MKKDNIPDVTGFPLDRAIQLLEKQGTSYYVKKALPYRPPGKVNKDKNEERQSPAYRVIRQTKGIEGVVELVIALEIAAI